MLDGCYLLARAFLSDEHDHFFLLADEFRRVERVTPAAWIVRHTDSNTAVTRLDQQCVRLVPAWYFHSDMEAVVLEWCSIGSWRRLVLHLRGSEQSVLSDACK